MHKKNAGRSWGNRETLRCISNLYIALCPQFESAAHMIWQGKVFEAFDR
jgi:hypothetical protein